MKLLINVLSAFLILFLGGCQVEESITASDIIVIINSNSPKVSNATEKVIPYLNHFGAKFKTVDLAKEKFSSDSDNYALVIISHAEITYGNSDLNSELECFLINCQSKGIGILSFDSSMPSSLLTQSGNERIEDRNVGELKFSENEHYITGYHQPGEVKELFGYMSIPNLTKKVDGLVLLTGNNHPLLIVSRQGTGKVVQWTSQDWMYSSILGQLGGLDDCLWKSIAWAARKPFAMQALPPIATMRVDDVVGSGRQQWNETPFFWVKTVNKYGLKPWLGLFIYNLSPEGVEELRGLINSGLATASPHAFGRPPRPESSPDHFDAYYKDQMVKGHLIPDYYFPKAITYLSDYYDEFIFFDHNNRKPWTYEISNKTLKAVDDWYSEVGPLPMSNYLIPHWGEMGTNMVAHVHDKWDIEFIALRMLDKSWGDQATPYRANKGNKPVKIGPFKLYDELVVGKPKENGLPSRASYSADFMEFAGKKFFNFSSVITDISGYELQPDNNVEATAFRGIQTLRRGIEAKALAVLFTHETDYIFKVRPENWDQIFRKISEGVSSYNPIYLNTDEALKIVRAFHTSKIQASEFNVTSGELIVKLSGEADVPTSLFVYTEDNGRIIENLIEIPAFENEVIKVCHLAK